MLDNTVDSSHNRLLAGELMRLVTVVCSFEIFAGECILCCSCICLVCVLSSKQEGANAPQRKAKESKLHEQVHDAVAVC